MTRELQLQHGTLDFEDRTVRLPGRQVATLTALEVEFLRYLHARSGETVPTAELLAEVWKYSPMVETRAVTYTVARVRAKIELDPSQPVHLLTTRGVGFRFELARSDPFPLVGRTKELEAMAASRGGCLALVGGAGFGKTTLARAWSSRQGREVVWCDLTDARDLHDVLSRLASALDHPPVSSIAPLAEALQIRDALLVLDNAELVADVVGELVPELTSPVLITSRVRISSAPTLTLQTLPQADAVHLFHREAEQRVVGWSNQDQGRFVEDIARRLHGLPLALVLAASGLRWFGPEEIARRLQESLELLEASPEGALSAAIDRSVRMLTPETRHVLAWLSCFRRDPRLTWIERVLGSRVERPLVALTELEQHGLLRIRDGVVRVWVGVREAAAVLLDASGEASRATAAHTAFFLQSYPGPEALDELLAVHQRTLPTQPEMAHQALLTILDEWSRRFGPRDILERLRSTEAAVPLHPRLKALMGWCLWRLGEGEDAAAAFAAAETGADDDDAVTRSMIWRLHAGQLHESGETASACELLERSVAALQPCDEPSALAASLNALGVVYTHLGRIQKAREVLFWGIECAQSDLSLQATLFNSLGNMHLREGASDEARAAYQQALTALGEVRSHKQAVIKSNLGAALLSADDLEGSKQAYQQAVVAHRRSGRRRSLALSLGNLGRLHHLLDELDPAIHAFQASVQHLEVVGDHERAGWFRVLLATALLDAGREAEAARSMRIAREHEALAPRVLGDAMEALFEAHTLRAKARRGGSWAEARTALEKLQRVDLPEFRPMAARLARGAPTQQHDCNKR